MHMLMDAHKQRTTFLHLVLVSKLCLCMIYWLPYQSCSLKPVHLDPWELAWTQTQTQIDVWVTCSVTSKGMSLKS